MDSPTGSDLQELITADGYALSKAILLHLLCPHSKHIPSESLFHTSLLIGWHPQELAVCAHLWNLLCSPLWSQRTWWKLATNFPFTILWVYVPIPLIFAKNCNYTSNIEPRPWLGPLHCQNWCDWVSYLRCLYSYICLSTIPLSFHSRSLFSKHWHFEVFTERDEEFPIPQFKGASLGKAITCWLLGSLIRNDNALREA